MLKEEGRKKEGKEGGRKEGRKEKRTERRKEGRKMEGKEGGRKEEGKYGGRKERRKEGTVKTDGVNLTREDDMRVKNISPCVSASVKLNELRWLPV